MSKLNLINQIKNVYDIKVIIKNIKIPKINRDLNLRKFKKKTGYKFPGWEKILQETKLHYEKNKILYK